MAMEAIFPNWTRYTWSIIVHAGTFITSLAALDIGCFAPLKRMYGRLVENKMRLGFNHIDKLDFLEAYPNARTEAFKRENDLKDR